VNRSAVGLIEIAEINNLAAAFHAAARGKRGRGDVEAFRANLDRELEKLRTDLLAGTFSPAPMRRFRIHDPKPRLIHAPCFRDRVAHHAIMAHVGPVLDSALVFDTYACRPGKGTLAAVKRASEHARDYEWFAQIDIRAYFASIDHAGLLGLLGRKFKNPGLLRLLAKIIEAHEDSSGRGLPIGTLTSQHFANFYLAGLDRFLLESCRVRGFVRYMDDVVWWADDRATAKAALPLAISWLTERLHLEVKRPVRLGRSAEGLNFCGFRILPYRLLLSRRRRTRYGLLRRRAERLWLSGVLDATGLQAGFGSALALTVHADAASWRRQQLVRQPVDPALANL
jgi:RNA-directed DNA polymerase